MSEQWTQSALDAATVADRWSEINQARKDGLLADLLANGPGDDRNVNAVWVDSQGQERRR